MKKIIAIMLIFVFMIPVCLVGDEVTELKEELEIKNERIEELEKLVQLYRQLDTECKQYEKDVDNQIKTCEQRIDNCESINIDLKKRINNYIGMLEDEKRFQAEFVEPRMNMLEREAGKKGKWYNKFWVEFIRDLLIITAIDRVNDELRDSK